MVALTRASTVTGVRRALETMQCFLADSISVTARSTCSASTERSTSTRMDTKASPFSVLSRTPSTRLAQRATCRRAREANAW